MTWKSLLFWTLESKGDAYTGNSESKLTLYHHLTHKQTGVVYLDNVCIICIILLCVNHHIVCYRHEWFINHAALGRSCAVILFFLCVCVFSYLLLLWFLLFYFIIHCIFSCIVFIWLCNFLFILFYCIVFFILLLFFVFVFILSFISFLFLFVSFFFFIEFLFCSHFRV